MARYNDQTAIGGFGRDFPETQWTRLHSPAQRDAILVELCERYWKPLYQYLRYRGCSNDQAKDLVQGFFTEKVLGQELTCHADRSRGRFRNFLMVALRNYAINAFQKDKDRNAETLDELFIEPVDQTGPDTVFDRAWAESLLEDILTDLKAEYQDRGKPEYWDLFREWLLEPNLDEEGKSMDCLCSKYQIRNTNQAYKMIFKTKARFRSLLREKLLCQVGSEEEVDAEIGRFIDIFSTSTGRNRQ